MRLAEYLKDHEIENVDFAEAIGVSVQALSRYRRGQRRPEWDVLERIQQVTNGAVTPNDFLSKEEAAPSVEAAT